MMLKYRNKKISYLLKFFLGLCLVWLLLTFIIPDVKQLGGGYVFLGETKIIYNRKTNYEVGPCVEDYKYNRNYIIVKQKVPQYKNVIYNSVEYPESLDSVFFYVIEKHSNIVLGPLDSIMFNDCISKLQVGLVFEKLIKDN